MGKTKIEWVKNQDGTQGYTLNPVKGKCPVACSYCYARRMYDRFKWDPEIRYIPIAGEVAAIKKPSRIFVGSTMELFGQWIPAPWLSAVFSCVRQNPQHTFIFLTKRPQNLAKWSPFPENCWVGASVTNANQLSAAYTGLHRALEATVKFISHEPLLDNIVMEPQFLLDAGISWVVCGQQTPVKPATMPKIEWIKEIVEAADKAGVPVFEKNNLASLLKRPLRQEFPE